MKKSFLSASAWMPAFANDLTAYVPEFWAQESLMILENELIVSRLVHRDFADEIANFGDTVNTRAPATFTAKRKNDGDDITIQDANATNVAVKLNQHAHVSFVIRDGEQTKSFKDLVNENIRPAAVAMAEKIDQSVMGTMWSFLGDSKTIGKLGTTVGRSTLTALRNKLNGNKVPMAGRNFVVCSSMEEALLNTDNLITAEKVGDDGSKLREGSVGRAYGLNVFMSQIAPEVATGNTVVTGAVNNTGGYAAGDTAITVDGLSAAIAAGTWCTIGGDMTPQMITGTTGGATPTALAISPGLQYAVANDAVVTIYTAGAVNLSAGYAADWAKALAVDGFSVAPRTGQLISFGTTAARYAVTGVPTTTEIDLNDALAATVANDAVVGIGPAGSYGFGFHRNAISLVSRPLALPPSDVGAKAAVINYNDLAIRAVISYSGVKQGLIVTLDCLYGVKVLDTALGAVVFG